MMKLTTKIVFVVVVIGGLARTRCGSADLEVDRSTSNRGGGCGGYEGPVSRLVRMLYHNVCTDRKQPEFYHPKPSGIDAFRPRCGLFKLHDSFLDSNAFGCAGGHRALLDDTGDNSINEQEHSGLHLARKRRMAGSLNVNPEEAPYYAQIVGLSWYGMPWRNCGGTIIHKNLVLTAAHCIPALSESEQIGVVVGTNKLAIVGNEMRHDGKLVYVQRYIIERNFKYGSYSTNDLAILKLATNLEYNDRVQPVCLRLQSAPRNDAICFAAGRGAVNRNQEFSPYLGGMPMEMDPSSYDLPANETFRWTPLIEATVCRGDSGSGLVCYDSCDDSGVVRAHLVGLLSSLDYSTFACEERKQRGGYVNLHGLSDRVRAMVAEILK